LLKSRLCAEAFREAFIGEVAPEETASVRVAAANMTATKATILVKFILLPFSSRNFDPKALEWHGLGSVALSF
jgi:hypothetical protein